MKIKRIIFAVILCLITVAGAIFSACGADKFKESTEKIDNPDQGFYRPIFVKADDTGATYNKNIINQSTRLYHLRIDISAYSKAVNGVADKQLTDAALNGLDGLLSSLREKDKNAIVRFAYDPYYNGKKDQEPAPDVILKHIEQVCPIIEKYPNTVTAIEAGLIGPWGEMHSSAIAKPENITKIIEAFLSHTQSVPVLVRTPKMIYDYLGITVKDIDNYEIAEGDKAYRLGLFNDGYLGSKNDLGTYTDRQREVEFLSKQTAHMPFGGEVVIPDSNLHDIEVCLGEMNKINLSYLNVEWNNQVIEKWKNSNYTRKCGSDKLYYKKSAFEYIQNHMGYRFVLTDASLKYKAKTGGLTADLKLKNVGFGNLNRTKRAKLIFTDESGAAVLYKDLESFKGEEQVAIFAEAKLPEGKYGVYLRLYGEELNGNPLYCIQFANEETWSAELKANKIGDVEIR